MCRGCTLRERMVVRMHTALTEAVAKVDAARAALNAVAIDTAGPTRRPQAPPDRAPPFPPGLDQTRRRLRVGEKPALQLTLAL